MRRLASSLTVLVVALGAIAGCSSDSPKAKNTPLTNPATSPTDRPLPTVPKLPPASLPTVPKVEPDATALVVINPSTPSATVTTTVEQKIQNFFSSPDWTVEPQNVKIDLQGKQSVTLRLDVVNHTDISFETVGIGTLDTNGQNAVMLIPSLCLSEVAPIASDDYPECSKPTGSVTVSLTKGVYVLMADNNVSQAFKVTVA